MTNNIMPIVDSEKHAHFPDEEEKVDDGMKNYSSDSDSDFSEDDEETKERSAAFARARGSAGSSTNDFGGNEQKTQSIQRYDEYKDFLTRSERSGKSREEIEQSESAAGSGKVGFLDPLVAGEKEIPTLTDEDKRRCFMTSENWNSIDVDVDVTKKRWQNHMTGQLPFDYVNNSIRGLENVIMEEMTSNIPLHQRSVLTEVLRQKREGCYPDWEAWSAISCKISSEDSEKARKLAMEDKEAMENAWKPQPEKTKVDPVKSPKSRRSITMPPSPFTGKKNPLRGMFNTFKKK